MEGNTDDIYKEETKCTCYKQRSYFQQTETWKHAVSQITRSLYNSTAIGLPPADPHLGLTNLCTYCKERKNKVGFNSDPFGVKDALDYRRERSEHLLFRIYHKIPLDWDTIQIVRLSRGIFIVQQARPRRYLQQDDILNAFLNDTSANDFLPMDGSQMKDASPFLTFDYNDISNLIATSMNSHQPMMINHSRLDHDFVHCDMDRLDAVSPPILSSTTTTATTANSASPSAAIATGAGVMDDFIPFAYTVGARYCSQTRQQRDYLIRGSIPLWCQTLLLFGFYNAEPPIQPNETRYGLVPFAPELPLHFRQRPDSEREEKKEEEMCGDGEDEPELLFWYERFAMDHMGHNELGGHAEFTELFWRSTRQKVLEDLIYCLIPPDLAQTITDLGNGWARKEGYVVA